MTRFAASLLSGCIALPLLALPVGAAPSLSLSSAGGPGGSKINLLLTLSGGEGVAGIRTQINFDPQVLSFDQATCGQLGSLFDFSADMADGCLYLTFARSDQLTSGKGILARLGFSINRGARPGLRSDLAVAQAVVVNQRGAKLALDMAPLTPLGTSVWVTNSPFTEFVDLDSDALGDDWEDASGSPTARPNTFEDPDRDGRVNILEFALGSNPLIPDSEPTMIARPVRIGSEEYLGLSYSRNKAASNCRFVLERSEDLTHWSDLPETAAMVETTDLGAVQMVTVRETQPIRLLPAHFFRLRIAFW